MQQGKVHTQELADAQKLYNAEAQIENLEKENGKSKEESVSWKTITMNMIGPDYFRNDDKDIALFCPPLTLR